MNLKLVILNDLHKYNNVREDWENIEDSVDQYLQRLFFFQLYRYLLKNVLTSLRILPILNALKSAARGPIEKFGKAAVSKIPRSVPMIKAKSKMLWLSQK